MFDNFRIYLRALELDDYKKSIKWRKDDEIWGLLTGPKYFVSEAYEKKWVENAIYDPNNKLSFAICLKETDEHIGYAYLNNIDLGNRSASAGMLIGEKKHWGEDFGTEASIQMLFHAFRVLGLERVEARQLTSNVRAIRHAEKMGYKKEGILRNAVFKNGRFEDVNLMSIIREDFEKIINGLD